VRRFSESELFLDYLSLRKYEEEARTLTGGNKIECLHLQHLLREEELAGRDASLALDLTTGNTQEANLTGYLSEKLEDLSLLS
jgi:hypothetical protein